MNKDEKIVHLNIFKEMVFEIAFGDDAVQKDYSESEVLDKLREFSDLALAQEIGNDEDFEAMGVKE